ncbi:SpoIVB peptidase [Haloimpatiens sp. FM7330]|uniref:SpoIVB peptidase n=1 Tax=Haloimpatiens sp. FM7330 TaxID=3298610 RepID=UPI003644291E
MNKKISNIISFILTPLFILILSFQYKVCTNCVNPITVNAHPNIEVYPGGQPIGVKLNTKGALVVALSDVQCEDGKECCPGSDCGIRVGDSIVKINNKEVTSCEQISEEVVHSDGKELNLLIERKGNLINRKIKPQKSYSEDKYKIGLWIRDSTAGIGTLTFYDPKHKKFGALGHAITDMDTGNILKVRDGEIISSSIISIKKGVKGEPGELKGIFVNEESTLGNIKSNTNCGIFGECDKIEVSKKFNKPLKVAYRNEIKPGNAKVLTTINGGEPELYDIKIQQLLPQDSPGPKSMVIKITDKRLLDKTGGIIQGMSGSPIIQDNKLVGAVTHVLVNKPDVGYGVYIEWMLKDAKIISK